MLTPEEHLTQAQVDGGQDQAGQGKGDSVQDIPAATPALRPCRVSAPTADFSPIYLPGLAGACSETFQGILFACPVTCSQAAGTCPAVLLGTPPAFGISHPAVNHPVHSEAPGVVVFAQQAVPSRFRLSCASLRSPSPWHSSDTSQAGLVPSNSPHTPPFPAQTHIHPPCCAIQT